ncbi:HNH endonuclease [Nakamurella flava]|uniref:HNH endonuclease n=1 Tax=Nakamurella flava TaxID=2576308 RepID=A0A4U6QA28_9ACTN|nr:HNH endonuclease [Nakamurella flava]TKV56784.1 HNH endonuclease [Nakamurella flava]
MGSSPGGQLGRSDRMAVILARDGDRCVWCDRPFGRLVPPTTDHLIPRVKGGPSWLENEVAACRRCNGQRGHLGPVDWLAECERRCWAVHVTAIGAALDRLAAAIVERGGQRRARQYLQTQRRRFARRT